MWKYLVVVKREGKPEYISAKEYLHAFEGDTLSAIRHDLEEEEFGPGTTTPEDVITLLTAYMYIPVTFHVESKGISLTIKKEWADMFPDSYAINTGE